jgi:pimeloyl-ACP methyl ester carboxylesterase
MWKGFPETVAQSTGCSALVYSRYGNGFSEVLTEDRAVSYMHDEARQALPQILDTFGIRDAILIGHSDGASIAFIYAGEVRDRVRALVAQAPHVFVEDLSIKTIARARVLYETTDLRARLRRYHQDVDRTFYGWNDIWLNPDFRGWNIREYVRSISVPMLLIQGADDEYGSSAQLQAIREDAGGPVDTLYLANCGHAPHTARSDIVTSMITAFVRTVQS